MTHKVYTCSAREWEFARLFSITSGSNRGYRSMPYIGCAAVPIVWMMMFLTYYLVTAMYPESKEGLQWIKEWAIAAGILIGLILFFRSLLVPAKSFVQPEPLDSIEYIKIDESGLYINLYNNTDPKVVPFFEWGEIKGVHLDLTKDLRHYDGGKAYPDQRERRIAALNSRYPSHPPEIARDRYEDRFTLLLNKGKGVWGLKYAIIQIPSSWLHDGSFQLLLQDITNYTEENLKPYDEQAAQTFQAWADHYQ